MPTLGLLHPGAMGASVGAALRAKVVGRASALKMAFAAWSKGSIALLVAARALAEAEGVGEALLDSWKRLSPGLVERSDRAALDAPPKAWRWVGEMHEIAASFESVGLPWGFHESAAALYERLAAVQPHPESVGAVLDGLLAAR